MIRPTAIILMFSGAATAAPVPGVDWDWQLSDPVKPPAVAVFDTDPDSVTKSQISQLKADGTYTICYVSVGTVEKYREDVDAFPAHVVGKSYDDWPNEKFLDIRQLGVILPLMKKRFERCKAYGFDAVEPDNMDVYDNDSGFPLSETDGVRYIFALAEIAHGMGLEIGQKNVPDITDAIFSNMDFVITESCFQDNWCGEVAAYAQAGKPIFDAEYSDEPINWNSACDHARELGISMILKDRDLHVGGKSCNK